jgi:hypothetical protein
MTDKTISVSRDNFSDPTFNPDWLTELLKHGNRIKITEPDEAMNKELYLDPDDKFDEKDWKN